MIDHKQKLEILTSIEGVCNVELLTYSGFNIWPLLRLAIYQDRNNDLQLDKVPNKYFKHFSLFDIVSNVVFYIKSKFAKYKSGKGKLNQDNIFVFFSRRENYTTKINNTFFDKHIDPIILNLKNNIDFEKIEILSRYNFFQRRFIKPYYLSGLSRKKVLFEKIVFEESVEREIDSINEYYYELTKKRLSLDWLSYYVQLVMEYSECFTKLFIDAPPRIALVTCYYSPENMGFILACKRLNILTVDIQHGHQSKFHSMYHQWNKSPSNGYDLLPDRLWLWNDHGLTNYEHNRCKNHIQREIGGNQFISMYLSNPNILDKNTHQEFYLSLNRYNKVILIACSAETDLYDLIHENVFSLMKRYHNWFWLIRLHPHSSKQYYSLIKSKLYEMGVENYDMTFSNECNLISLITKSDVVITNYSSVCLEAIDFEICRIITHEYGKDLFADLIESDKMYYADSSEKIKKIIQNSNNNENYADKIISNENAKYERTIRKLQYDAINS